MNIIDILKGIENLAVELLLWIIYIPKTIFKIIKDPFWVAGYVDSELNKKDKFTNYMSPILLYLGTSVILFVITDMIGSTKEKDFLNEVQGLEGLLFLVLPLLLALIIELFRKGHFNRLAILRGLYIQCYYFSPLMLALFAFNISDAFYWYSEDMSYSNIPLYLFLLTFLWYVIVEIKFISKDLKTNKIKAFAIFSSWLLILVISFVYYIVVTDTNVNKEQIGGTESYNLELTESGEYSIQISKMIEAVANSIGYFDAYSISIVHTDENGNNKLSNNEKQWYTTHNYMTFGQEYKGNTDEVHIFKGEEGDLVRIDVTHEEDDFIWGDELGVNIVKNGDLELVNNELSITTPLNIGFDNNLQKRYAEFYLPESGLFRFANFSFSKNPETYTSDYHIRISRIEQFYPELNVKAPEIKYYETYSGKFENSGLWNFAGKKGDYIGVVVQPIDSLDIAFNVYKDGNSVVPIHNNNIIWPLRWLYIFLFGYAVLIGFLAFFRKQKKEETQTHDTNAE